MAARAVVGNFCHPNCQGARAKVIATASTAKQDLLKELGADVAIDYTKQKFDEIARDVDVVLDSVGKDTLAHSYGVVKESGFIVTLVARIGSGGVGQSRNSWRVIKRGTKIQMSWPRLAN